MMQPSNGTPQSATNIEQPTGQVNIDQRGKDAPNWWAELGTWGRTFMQFGFAGAFLWLYFDDRSYDRVEQRENATRSREEHRETFKQMRNDNKEGREYDQEQRRKTNGLLREQTKVLEGMERTQLKVFDAILKKMP